MTNKQERSAEPVGCGECKVCLRCAMAQVNAMNALRAEVERLEGIIVDYFDAGEAIKGGALDRGMNRAADYDRAHRCNLNLRIAAHEIKQQANALLIAEAPTMRQTIASLRAEVEKLKDMIVEGTRSQYVGPDLKFAAKAILAARSSAIA